MAKDNRSEDSELFNQAKRRARELGSRAAALDRIHLVPPEHRALVRKAINEIYPIKREPDLALGVEDIPQVPTPEASRAGGAIGLPVAGSLIGAGVGTAVGGPVGAGIGESIGGAGGEALSQLLGFSDPNLTKIGVAGAAPAVGRGVLGIAKGAGRGLGSIFIPQQFRLAGTELAGEIFAGPESRVLFAIARKAGNVPTKAILGTLDDAIKAESGLSTPNAKALRLLTNFREKLAGKTANSYDDLINEVQRMSKETTKAFSRGDNVAGSTLSKAQKQILDEMDKISPAFKAANSAYRREQNIIKLKDLLSKGNPSSELGKLRRHDELFGGGFTEDEFAVMSDLVERLGRMPGQALGAGRAVFQALAEPVAEVLANPLGRQFLKALLKAPGDPAVIWSAAVQGSRAWLALNQGGNQPKLGPETTQELMTK